MQDPNKVIDALGGTAEVARMCELRMPTVSSWRKYGIPRPWYMYFTLLRPDLFPEENNRTAQPAP